MNCRNAASELASQMNSLSFCIAREDARMRHASSRLHSDKVFRADRLLIGWICQLWCAPRFRVERAHPRLSALGQRRARLEVRVLKNVVWCTSSRLNCFPPLGACHELRRNNRGLRSQTRGWCAVQQSTLKFGRQAK